MHMRMYARFCMPYIYAYVDIHIGVYVLEYSCILVCIMHLRLGIEPDTSVYVLLC